MPDEPSLEHRAAPRAANVLIVDDNHDAVEALGGLFEIAGHQVWLAHSGVTALDNSALAVADVALIDLGMPLMNGFELARIVRQQAGDEVLLVAVTGWERPGDLQASRAAGFDLYLTKPVDADDLLALITAFIAKHPRPREPLTLSAGGEAKRATASGVASHAGY